MECSKFKCLNVLILGSDLSAERTGYCCLGRRGSLIVNALGSIPDQDLALCFGQDTLFIQQRSLYPVW